MVRSSERLGRGKQLRNISKSIQVLLLSELRKGSLFTTVPIQTFAPCFCLKQVTEALLILTYCRRRNTMLKLFVTCKTKPRRRIWKQITELETSLHLFSAKSTTLRKTRRKNSREFLFVIMCTRSSNYKTLKKKHGKQNTEKHLSSIVSHISYNSSFFSF